MNTFKKYSLTLLAALAAIGYGQSIKCAQSSAVSTSILGSALALIDPAQPTMTLMELTGGYPLLGSSYKAYQKHLVLRHAVRTFKEEQQLGRFLMGHKGPNGYELPSKLSSLIADYAELADNYTPPLTLPHQTGIASLIFIDGGKLVAAVSYTLGVNVWDTVSGKRTWTSEKSLGPSSSLVVLDPDGRFIASKSDLDNSIDVRNATTGALIKHLPEHATNLKTLMFSPDGKSIAAAYDDHTIKLWDIASGDCLKTLEGHEDCVRAVAFSPDGSRLASASLDHTIKLWDIASGDCLQTLRGHGDWVIAVTFSSDGSSIASASLDHTIKVWDTISGHCIKTFRGHTRNITSITFSSDGSSIASASDDRTIKVWDIASETCIQTLDGHAPGENLVTFSPDGSQLASTSSSDRAVSNTVKVWKKHQPVKEAFKEAFDARKAAASGSHAK